MSLPRKHWRNAHLDVYAPLRHQGAGSSSSDSPKEMLNSMRKGNQDGRGGEAAQYPNQWNRRYTGWLCGAPRVSGSLRQLRDRARIVTQNHPPTITADRSAVTDMPIQQLLGFARASGHCLRDRTATSSGDALAVRRSRLCSRSRRGLSAICRVSSSAVS